MGDGWGLSTGHWYTFCFCLVLVILFLFLWWCVRVEWLSSSSLLFTRRLTVASQLLLYQHNRWRMAVGEIMCGKEHRTLIYLLLFLLVTRDWQDQASAICPACWCAKKNRVSRLSRGTSAMGILIVVLHYVLEIIYRYTQWTHLLLPINAHPSFCFMIVPLRVLFSRLLQFFVVLISNTI